MARQQYPDDSKVVQVAEGITYAYVYKPAQPNKPTFLLLHGFPSSSYDWRHQITDLPNAGYGVLVPDLLGYGDSSKPTAKEEYAWAKISAHVAKVLDNEGLTKVIGVGHDWYGFSFFNLVLYYIQI
jgi:pimeloyl-ACP methyl ester carboxylesterase